MAKKIMIQGSMSGVGKSFITAGLCRIFKEDGLRAAPFKSQNMALNSFVTRDGMEMGRAQVMQAEAAGVEPDVCMNPVLLKPTGDTESQVIVMGEPYKNMSAADYYSEKKKLIPKIMEAFTKLERENDIIVLEGAGSPAEININKDDIVNFGMAELAGSPVLLAGDIDRGGVFAQLLGTVMLLKDNEKKYLKGLIINKFRGDINILGEGVRMIEELTSFPVLGVVPYRDLKLDDEDSLSDRLNKRESDGGIDIAVIRLPHISNFTDFNPFELMENVSLRYVSGLKELGTPDLLILPGTKNTLGDLRWLKESGIADAITEYAKNNGIVFGICGGFQMLGEIIEDPENHEGGGSEKGLSLLKVRTVFSGDKTLKRTEGVISGITGELSGLNGAGYEGYEIHMGVSEGLDGINGIISNGNAYGTYIHGIFDKGCVTEAVIKALFLRKGLPAEKVRSFDMREYKEKQYSALADALRASLKMDMVYEIMDKGV